MAIFYKYKKLITFTLVLLVLSLLSSSVLAKTKRCRPIKPKNKYLASLSLDSITVCDNSGCETLEQEGLISTESQKSYFLRAVSRQKSKEAVSTRFNILDRSTFDEVQTNLISDCSQFSFSLPVPLNPGFADVDILEMECTGDAHKKRKTSSGRCSGTFFAFGLGETTFEGEYILTPTKKTIVNPCSTPEGILIFGSQCLNK